MELYQKYNNCYTATAATAASRLLDRIDDSAPLFGGGADINNHCITEQTVTRTEGAVTPRNELPFASLELRERGPVFDAQDDAIP